jgi:hypothetical protein
MSFSIPSARYTDKADGIKVKSLLGEQAVIQTTLGAVSAGAGTYAAAV